MYSLEELEQRVRKMRELGVTKWGDIELGALPAPEAKTETQQPKDPIAIERGRRVEVRRVALAASGALVPRLGEDRKQ